jgi:hypothetical protein
LNKIINLVVKSVSQHATTCHVYAESEAVCGRSPFQYFELCLKSISSQPAQLVNAISFQAMNKNL